MSARCELRAEQHVQSPMLMTMMQGFNITHESLDDSSMTQSRASGNVRQCYQVTTMMLKQNTQYKVFNPELLCCIVGQEQ